MMILPEKQRATQSVEITLIQMEDQLFRDLTEIVVLAVLKYV
jgi:hypothetical protein